MDGNNDNNTPQYPYNPYYYPQYYTSYPQQQQHVPQGDPSAALSSMMYQLQQQTQQRQAMGALAAASVSNALGNNRHHPSVEYYADYYAVQDQRSMINYNDITHANAAATTATATTATPTDTAVNENDPSPKKPKFCCNRWLKSAIAVAQHEKLHIKCPSCDHMCLKSALEEHEEIAHGKERKETNKKPSRPDGVIPPNAPRIDTPEELAAWIAARKKNWPSKDNVERKEQENAEKEARGELPANKKRKFNDRNRQQQPNKKSKTEEASLVASQYDSNSDSDDFMDPEKDAISSKDPSAMGKILLPEDRPKRRCKYFMMGKCKRGDACGFSHEKPEPKPRQPKNAPVFKKRPNLLFKLLEKDIMQEKSVILQCLRYIADNNYFGKGDSIDLPLKEESSVPKSLDEKEGSIADGSGVSRVIEETFISPVSVEQSEEAAIVEEAPVDQEQQPINNCDASLAP